MSNRALLNQASVCLHTKYENPNFFPFPNNSYIEFQRYEVRGRRANRDLLVP